MEVCVPNNISERMKFRIFLISVIAIFTSGLSFGLRGSIAGDIQSLYLDPFDSVNSAKMVGEILGVAFLGFSFTLFFSSPLLNIIGMGRMLLLASICFIVGTLVTVLAPIITTTENVYWAFWIGMGLTGVGWGFTESTTNPLTAAIYPNDKTHRMNILHAWWPAGIVTGGVSSLFFRSLGLSWQFDFALILIPSIVFLLLLIGSIFPNTERADSGVKFSSMIMEILRKPSFMIWFCIMFLTAATELAPSQWVDITLSNTIGMPGIAILIYVSSIMFFMRHSAGILMKYISNVMLLLISCIFATIGLYFLSLATDPLSAIIASTLWGIGVCFLWPTMLAITSERYPRGGEFFLGLLGSAGSLSIYFVLPIMGRLFDQTKIDVAGSKQAYDALNGNELENVLAQASQISFQSVIVFPIVLVIVFSCILIYDRAKV
ncbi:MFS transporter [Vibrio mediterranei]|uniref:MFS transporter n=1 Tax=Vibrio mediterranei TaxID=689 RepID=UPI001EFC4F64|nr:MFS transporter [Vibrio mediterranei]MCG9661267.1 MFS transporter [Vibrio mediterranei]